MFLLCVCLCVLLRKFTRDETHLHLPMEEEKLLSCKLHCCKLRLIIMKDSMLNEFIPLKLKACLGLSANLITHTKLYENEMRWKKVLSTRLFRGQ